MQVGVSKKNHDFARLDDDLAKLMAEKQVLAGAVRAWRFVAAHAIPLLSVQ